MKRAWIIAGFLLGAAAAVYWVGSASRKETVARPQPRAQRAISVKTVRVVKGAIERRLSTTGTVEPEAAVDVYSKVSGILESLHVERGDRVEENQIIAAIEARDREALVREAQAALEALRARWDQMEAGPRPEEIAQAEAAVRQARARWRNSLDNFKRLQSLRERKAVSPQRFDEGKLQAAIDEAAYRSARERLAILQKGAREEDRRALLAQIRQAEAGLMLAESRLDSTRIRAPFRGIIDRRYCDRGAFVGASKPIVRIVAMDRVRVLARITEGELSQVKAGGVAEVRVDAYPGRVFRGEVRRIGPTLDPQSRTAEVEIGLENAEYPLKPGMFARVELVVEARPMALLIPRDSLVGSQGAEGVFLNVNGRAAFRKVRLGIRDESRVEMLGGLSEHDEVILPGRYRLKDGAAVTVKGEASGP